MKPFESVFLCFFTIIFCVNIAWAQCPTGNLHLNTQQDISDFVAQYPNCTDITANVYIRTSGINDLGLLTQINSVGGWLMIERTHLTDMKGLDNLTWVDALFIGGNEFLINLNGLENFGTANWVSVGYFSPTDDFLGNPAIVSLDGLDNLTSVEEGLEITGNFELTDLTSLSNLSSVQYFNIALNSSLVTLDGLENLTSMESLGIGGNPSLTDITALSNLISLDDLYIANNDNLSNIDGLENIAYDTIMELGIRDNPMLSVCHLPNICAYLENEGNSEIHDNAPNCNSIEEVLALCTVPTATPDNQLQVVISPNPTNDTFTLQGIATGAYQILNTSGQIIRQGDMQNDLLVDISTEAQGIYFISVTIDNETLTRRIIKM